MQYIAAFVRQPRDHLADRGKPLRLLDLIFGLRVQSVGKMRLVGSVNDHTLQIHQFADRQRGPFAPLRVPGPIVIQSIDDSDA